MMNSMTPSRLPRQQNGGGTPKQRTPARRSSYAAAPIQNRGTPLRPHQLNAYASVPSPKPPLKASNSHSPLEEEAIQAIVRLRPLNANESKHRRIWKLLHEESAIALTKPTGEQLDKYVDSQNYFTIDKPFGEDATTKDVYDGCVLSIVKSVCTGLNGTIFAYGQTSSGKTFTMQGSGTIQQGSESEHVSGIIHMAAQDIFNHIESQLDRLFMVRASFLEVYNEEVRDLLSEVSCKLKVQESNGVVTTECKEVPVSDWKSLLEILAQGEQSRTFASTAMNERSSRSHTIFRVTLESRSNCADDEQDGTSLISTLNLVDLAGSESVRHTGATGERQVEGAKINKSLLTLYRVIDALATGKTHVAYRESNLTRLLQSSLSGNARMAFICCATPSELYLEETRSTLRFAANAKMVKTRPKINMVTDDKSRIRQLEKELAESMKQCTEANDKLQERLTSDAAMDYDVQRKKISQITSILLNYNPAPSKTAHASKRRLSEGIAFPRDESTSQIGAQASLTQPRPFKRVRVQKSEPLASSFELSLAKEALALKGQALKLSVQSRAELQESLASSLARSQEVESRLSSELDALRKDFEQAVKERDAGKIKIQEVIKNATKEQEALQEKQGALVLEKEELQLQLVKVTSRYELEKTQLVEQRDSADRIREDLERKVEILESDLSASRVEREELLAKSSSVEQESVVLKQELELSISLSRTVEEKNAVIKASLEKETSQFEAEKLKLHEEMAALLQVKEAAEQNITVLQDELASLSQLRDNLSNELEAIKRVHVTLEATTKNQEALLTERTTQLELTRKLLDEATQEAVSLKEQFETDQLAATRAMENLKADLASAQADSNTAFDSLQEMQVRYTSVASERDLIKSNLEEVNKCLTLALEREEKQKTVLGLLQGSTSELQSQIVSLESELQKSKLEYDDTERHYSATRTELERVLRENSDISAKHETLRRSYDSLEQQWAQLNNEYASSQECLSSKTLALESTTQSLLHHQRTSESLVVQNAKFSDEISRLKEALSECQSALASATKDLLSTRSEEESKARMLSEKLEVVESLLAENKELNDKWNLSQRDLTVALSQIDILSKRKDELESSLSEIQESQAQLIGEHEVTLSNFQSATDQIDRLKAELNEKVELLNKMMVEKASMQEQVASLTASENDLIQSNTDLRDRNIALVHELSEARSSGATDRTRFTDLSLALEAASRSRALIETELSEAMTEKEDLQGRMSALQMEYEKCTAEWQSSKMLLEDAQQKINSLELLDKAQVEQRDMLEDQNRRLKAQIQAIENRNQILEDSLVTAESKAKALASSVSTLEKDKLDIQNDANHRKNEVDSLTTEVELLRAQIETYLAHQIELKRQLDSAHGLLEVSNTQLRQKQASVYELEDQLTSMGNMLNECNALLDEKTAKISELEQHLATKTEPDESTILVGSLNKQVNSLTDECAEVKLLLASANEEIVLARDRASLLERQLEELRTKHELEKRSGHDTKNDLLVPELEKLRVEKAELEIVLQREVATRFQFESELKDRLGAERKSLIQEAESAMQNLRVELQTTKESLKRLGDEAYAGRQEFQELHERETAGQTKITELMHENEQLKLTIDQLGQGVKEEEILKKKVTDLKQKLCEAIDANSKLKIEAKKWKALKVTNESLRRELEAVTSSEKGGNDALAKLSEQLRLKDERIEKLEKNKFTVAHAESLKNLKASKCALEKENKMLRQRLEDVLAAETESMDVTQLRFDKEALENKYRKVILRCQELEDEKGVCLGVLRRNQQNVDDKNLVECIASVCDQLTSDLNQRSSISSDVECLVEEKRLLETTIRDQERMIESLQSEQEQLFQISGKMQDMEDKMRHLEQENFTLMTEKKELKKKYQHASKELNILRMKASDGDNVTMELQLLKRKAVTSKSSDHNHSVPTLNASLTSNATSSPFALRGLEQRQSPSKPTRQQLHLKVQGKNPTPLLSKPTTRNPAANDENARNRDVFSLDNITDSLSKSKPRNAPELGESHPATASDENTNECQQS